MFRIYVAWWKMIADSCHRLGNYIHDLGNMGRMSCKAI